MIPEMRSRILNFTLIIPVIAPKMTPAAVATSMARGIGTPRRIIVTVTAAPSGNVPSTERSGKSSIL